MVYDQSTYSKSNKTKGSKQRKLLNIFYYNTISQHNLSFLKLHLCEKMQYKIQSYFVATEKKIEKGKFMQ